MSIVTEIERIKSNIANAYNKCEEKGATLPDILNSANLADCISSITGAEIINPVEGYVTDGLIINLSGLEKPFANWWLDSYSQKTATMFNSPSYNADEKSYTFNGINQYGTFTLADSTTGDFTMEVYYKQDTVGDFDLMVGQLTGSMTGYGLINRSGTHYCWFYKGSTQALPTEDRPAQIAGRKQYTSISRGTSTIYFNFKDIERNISKNYAGASGSLGVTTFAIARNGNGTNDNAKVYSNANIYAIRIYNRKLTAEEMQKNYEQDVRNFGA